MGVGGEVGLDVVFTVGLEVDTASVDDDTWFHHGYLDAGLIEGIEDRDEELLILNGVGGEVGFDVGFVVGIIDTWFHELL